MLRSLFWSLLWTVYVVVVAIVGVVVDVDDEEREGGGEDTQRIISNNPNLKCVLACMNLYRIHIVHMQCVARCMFFGTHLAPALHPDRSHCPSEAIRISADAACRRPVSFLRMMHHCIMAPGFRHKVCPANRPQGRRQWDWQRNWFPMHAILAV